MKQIDYPANEQYYTGLNAVIHLLHAQNACSGIVVVLTERHSLTIIVDREMIIITLQHQKTLYLFFKESKDGNENDCDCLTSTTKETSVAFA